MSAEAAPIPLPAVDSDGLDPAWDEAFLRAWIKNPFAFRVSVMPPSPQLGEDDLGALLAYLSAMKEAKIDVAAPGGH